MCTCTQYYANEEYARQAWFGIIGKIAHLLGPLQEEPPIVGTEDDRQKLEETIRVRRIQVTACEHFRVLIVCCLLSPCSCHGFS